MISFREMVPEDAAGVEVVEKASFALPWSRKSFWEEAANERTFYLVALDGEQIVGYAGTWLIVDEAQITNIALLPDYRGRGIGTAMLGEIIRESVRRGAERMTLEVRPSNKVAQALYTAYGFKDFGRRRGYYQDNKEDAIIMWNMELRQTAEERCLT